MTVHSPATTSASSTDDHRLLPCLTSRRHAGAMSTSPLVVTRDPDVLERATRWCAAVGASPEVATDVPGCRRGWREAPVVLVGADLADDLAAAGLVRRDRVYLVAAGDDPAVWRAAVHLGAAAVLEPTSEQDAVDVLGGAVDGRGEACLVAVVGACGGVGASTFAAGLAVRGTRRGLRSLLVDADPCAGGIDLLMGAEHVDGVRWSDLGHTAGRVSAEALAEVVPTHRGVGLVTWAREASIGDVRPGPVLDAAARGFDLVVADVPRDPGRLGTDVLARAVLTVLVVTDDVRGLAAAERTMSHLAALTTSVVGVLRPRAGGVGRSETARVLGLPVPVRVRHDRRLRTAVDRGLGPHRSRPLGRAADPVLDLLGLDRP
ncbi:CpaE-like protein [Aeromicrobium marinum DSM 15272]|uniref:CpaE-like protein n=2 Tax=Aeromicrobium marinum TaxID=219314 RepID=E2SFI0_9ACTN|nr:CpaE-like protein [Aeromicrobium marinum DSM 15272]